MMVRRRFHLLFFLSCFLCAAFSVRADHRYKIAVVHSYERNYHDAGRYRKLLEEELTANGISFEIREFFLDCEELDYYLELARASYFIDNFTAWGADAVAVFNNQAVYSLLKCDNPKLHRVPVVFSGLYCPEEETIRQYPNVTGFVDIPDYAKTVRMIEHLIGPSRIIVMSATGIIDRSMWRNLNEQCHKESIQTYDGEVQEHILRYRTVKQGIYDESQDVVDNERIDTTVVMRMMSETLPLRIIQQTARGSHTCLMMVSRTFSSMDASEFFTNPSFGAINEGFGSQDNMLGGYFVPLENQIKDMAESICLRLRGGMPAQQMAQGHKQYVLNWNVMQRYGISDRNLPPEYRIMYIPFSVRYRYYILTGSVLAGFCILALFVYLTHSLARERRRKQDAQRNLHYEHETLKLAIEGGTTYAWRKEKEGLSFDTHFYELIEHNRESITLEQLLTFIYPDDRKRFRETFLQDNLASPNKEQYRCKFGGEYEWWEFRYSFITNEGHVPVVTGLLQNIQEVKDREEELIQARRLAERAELKQSFLNNMNHEIRTPLNAIVGFSNILIETPDLSEEEKQEYVDIINLNNKLLLNLINDILELSRIDSGSVSFNMQKEELHSLLNSYYNAFRVQVKPDLEFLCDLPEGKVAVCVDAMRLQQVVNNFLANANKFTDTGYIRLGYRYQEGDDKVRIFVEDTGRGIPSEELNLIFERFYKHDEFVQGTGLGLAICRSIVEQLEGDIEVESEEGKGSCFTIVLPVN